MEISCFDDLLRAARQQTEPQRLLLVFAGASLPADANAEQRASFDSGQAGELAPLMCVDKDPRALAGFDALAEEARGFGQSWALVFAAALSGRDGREPPSEQVQAALQQMVEAVRAGQIERFIPFDRHGDAVQLG